MTFSDLYSAEFLVTLPQNLRNRRTPMTPGDIQHGVLIANQVNIVNLSAHFSKVTVINRSGTDEIFFTTDKSDPAIGAEGTVVLPAAIWSETVEGIQQGTEGKTVVKLISASPLKYTVIGE